MTWVAIAIIPSSFKGCGDATIFEPLSVAIADRQLVIGCQHRQLRGKQGVRGNPPESLRFTSEIPR